MTLYHHILNIKLNVHDPPRLLVTKIFSENQLNQNFQCKPHPDI